MSYLLYDCTTNDFTRTDETPLRVLNHGYVFDKRHKITTIGIDLSLTGDDFNVCVVADDFINSMEILYEKEKKINVVLAKITRH